MNCPDNSRVTYIIDWRDGETSMHEDLQNALIDVQEQLEICGADNWPEDELPRIFELGKEIKLEYNTRPTVRLA